MGGMIAKNITRPLIEKCAFPTPAATYDETHPNLCLLRYDGTKQLSCVKFNYPHSKKVILFSHGNGEDLGKVHKDLQWLSNELKVNIFAYDYPGYGLSSGKATEQSCKEAILIAYEYLKIAGFQPNNIILYGFSIGTGPSVFLASLVPGLKGCLLQSPYTSVVGVISPALATCMRTTESSVCHNPDIFQSSLLISKIKCPIRILHGTHDQRIAYAHATKLCQKSKNATLVTLQNATHNNIFVTHRTELVQALNTLIQ